MTKHDPSDAAAAASEPDSAELREERLARVARALARHLPESTARELVRDALTEAGLDSVPAQPRELASFVDRHLSDAIATRVGPAVAEHWMKSLRHELGSDLAAESVQRAAHSPGAPVSTAIDPWLGRVLAGRYRVLQKVATSRRGATYRAERTEDSLRVAIKLVEPAVYQSQARFEERLAYEAQVARALTHPHTLVVYDLGRADDRWMFMAVEWLSGIDLARMLEQRGPLNARQAMYLAHQACRSLAHAHSHGVVHGDLSPEGLFVARQSTGQSVVKVMDYGRRRFESFNDEGHSQVGLPKGWARYLAPEQIVGGEFDQRADVYALGAILYRALSGELPFQDSTGIGILMSQVHDRPPPLRTHAAAKDVPEAVEALVMRCLEKDPDARFETAAELVELTQQLTR